ncbi:hypothetical protein OEZ86_010625 [Tetradesmus obliquus]|nr:hypothetical protein OEZ86_010625 [Tetradesmus obliquus]
MAGLAAALALAPSFDRVLLLEADTPQDCWQGSAADVAQAPGQPRRGVSQYRFMHALLARGATELEALCPGYLAQLQAAGANMTDYYQDLRFGTPAGPFARVTQSSQPLPIVQASRHLLEHTLRRFVQQHPKVTVMYGAAAAGLVFEGGDSSRRVVGVQLAGGGEVRGDLVVAAAGRRLKLPGWLQAGGWPAAPVTSVSANTAYTTWFLRMPPEVEASLPYSGVYHSPSPPECLAGAYLQRDEAGLWMVCGISFDRQAPQPSLEAALSWMKQAVYSDEVHALVSQGTPVSPVRMLGALNNTWSHYEQVPPPPGLVVLGDAYCSLNPTYAQGITVAAIQARLLGQLLAQRIAAAEHAHVAAGAAAADASASSSSSSSSSSAASLGTDNSSASSAAAAGRGEVAARRAAVAAAVSGLNGEFYAAAAGVVGAAWGFAAGRDMLYPFAQLQGESRTLQWRLMQGYVSAIFKVAAVDSETAEANTANASTC